MKTLSVSMTEGAVGAEERDGVLVCTLDRPARGNRLTPTMCEALLALLERVRRDDGLAGCVLTGAGDAFCEGGDFRASGLTVAGQRRAGELNAAVITAIREAGKPVVAAVNGNAHAGGMALVAACDLAFCAPHATFGLPEARHGLFPLMATAVVKDQLPQKVFFELVYRQSFLSAGDAAALHFVNDVLPAADLVDVAVAQVAATKTVHREVLALGRGLYFGLRAGATDEGLELARLALSVGITAMTEAESRQPPGDNTHA